MDIDRERGGMDFLQYVLAGAGVGFLVGLTGVGGGSLMTPLLLLFGFSAPVAIGTDLLYAAITKTGGALAHHRHGNVDWKIVLLLGAGSVPVSLLVHLAIVSSDLLSDENFEDLLTSSLGVMLIVTSIILILKNKLIKKSLEDQPGTFMGFLHGHRNSATLLMGMLLGFCVTLSSVGAGAFAAAVLMVIYAQTGTARIIGTDVAHAVPLTLLAGLGYLINGYVNFALLLSLLVGSLPAIYLGSHLSHRVPDKLLQNILTVLLLSLGTKYAFF